ncbi:class I SAM-dependent methyltransferase [Bradyrhizobium sp.]|jgi:SAM-dependent methyltransferase|uniref:class I SAM-dependent methyltransferase n=1 Tax=Bradyrhizobium sp. TaxID=376 RepID=UPI002DDD96BF|nr:class I SAM-dependent methyltransferase [Bradyrhizobium sp.]HEV2154879.1 class I SAM-dependent methyltransferase [Bradyrhizobium sp.]
MNCRHCAARLKLELIDLGSSPPSNAYLSAAGLLAPEKTYPLKVMVCEQCWLVQTLDFAQADELFSAEYAYFSSFSTTWLQHAERYVADMVERFHLGRDSHVVEIASNDGYLLQYVKGRGIPCLGIEPTASTARASREKGIETLEEFFGAEVGARLAAAGRQADLMAANNVLAHVPDINDFLSGFTNLLKPDGVATFEFPHLLRLIEENQFDTIYHEHFSYLSLTALEKIFRHNGLAMFDVEELPTHGGSLRVFTQRAASGSHAVTGRIAQLLVRESAAGLASAAGYSGFQSRAEKVKDDLLAFLIEAKRAGKRVAAYGAAAKGNTLLNFAGVRRDLIAYVVDRNPAKQDRYMPGSRIPIVDEARLLTERPDYVVILPWNLKSEVMDQLRGAGLSDTRFVTAVPALDIV